MDFLHSFLGSDPRGALLVIINLIVIESLLSVDNAAVLATMVMDLPPFQRKRALRYGILFAYIFRGLCLFAASWLVRIWWLKPLGGLYLMYLTLNYFRGKNQEGETAEEETIDKNKNWLYRATVGSLGAFGSTVALVEVMDLAFSIDNVFAAVAFTNNLYLIYTGVFIGILAMRFVAQAFVKLMERFTFLETVAFLVIGVLGLKLSASVIVHFAPGSRVSQVLEGRHTDVFVSLFTVAVFVLPVLSSLAFGFPRNRQLEATMSRRAEKIE